MPTHEEKHHGLSLRKPRNGRHSRKLVMHDELCEIPFVEDAANSEGKIVFKERDNRISLNHERWNEMHKVEIFLPFF